MSGIIDDTGRALERIVRVLLHKICIVGIQEGKRVRNREVFDRSEGRLYFDAVCLRSRSVDYGRYVVDRFGDLHVRVGIMEGRGVDRPTAVATPPFGSHFLAPDRRGQEGGLQRADRETASLIPFADTGIGHETRRPLVVGFEPRRPAGEALLGHQFADFVR